MERYSEYKDSGIYYIPLIPSSWNVLKGKILFKEEKRPIRQQDEIVTCFRDGQVTLRKNRRLEGFTNSLKEIGYQGIRKGDLVIHNMDAFAGAIGVSDSDGKGTPVYAVCTPIREDVNQYYYCFLLRFLAKIGFIQSLAKGIRERSSDFRYGDFKELLLPVPSRAEQDAIVSYLDAATSKIDKAIVMQQKMIDLLNERKQIIIQNAVTKGLDENVEMKDSGVEWIGMIPKHWEISSIKHLINLLTDYDANGSFADIAQNCNINNGTPYAWMVRTTDLVNKRYGIVNGNNYCDKKTYDYLSKSSLSINDIIIAKRGDIGKAFLIPDINVPMTLAPNTYLLKTIKAKINNNFLYYALSSKYGKDAMTIFNKSTTLGALYKDDVKALPIACPPLTEQIVIAAHLDKEMQRFDSAITNCQRQITLLQERKQIIINEVVTGKVKVS